MLNIFYDSYSILNKVYSEGAFLKQAMLAVPIEEKNRSATTKICYGVLERDILLSHWIKCLCEKNPKLVIRTVLKISMYNIAFMDKAPYAVTDTAVELCNKLGKKGVSGFVNAVLRKFVGYKFPEIKSDNKRLSLEYDYPEFAVEKLVRDFGKERACSVMKADVEKTCLRFSDVNGAEYLAEKGIAFEQTPFDNVYFAERFVRNSDYDKGVYTFQSIGSVAICDAVGAGERLLDACAAPGGKSVLLSKSFDTVVSQELHAHRAELIKDYSKRMHTNNISVVVGDASEFNPSFEMGFDTVLCDVPCSGFGVMKSNPDIKLKKEAENIAGLSALQLKILSNCSRYVKNGGRLIYSTCTLFKEENDWVAKDFLSKNKEFTSEIISLKIPYLKTKFGYQMLPDISFGAGFYICSFRRI